MIEPETQQEEAQKELKLVEIHKQVMEEHKQQVGNLMVVVQQEALEWAGTGSNGQGNFTGGGGRWRIFWWRSWI